MALTANHFDSSPHVTSTFNTQQQSLCQLVSAKVKEKLLVENTVLLYAESKQLVSHFILFKLIPLPELVQGRSVLFLFHTKLVNWQCKAFAQFYDGTKLEKGLSNKRLQFV